MSKNYYNCVTDYNYEKQECCDSPCKAVKECKKECFDNSYVVGNSVDFCVDKCDSEIKADIRVGFRDTVRVWGQIIDCEGRPVPYAYVKLVKITNDCQEGIAHTVTDCLGYYQFDLCQCNDGAMFRLLVGKASVGGEERVISTGIRGTNCNPCDDEANQCANPCKNTCNCR